MSYFRVVPCGLVVLGLLVGCGRGSSGGVVGTVHVTGIVTMDGQPLEGATVTFTSPDFQASGRTAQDGHYELTQDATPGDYKVTVRKFSGATFEVGEGMDEGQFEAMALSAEENAKRSGVPAKDVPTQLIPAQFSDPTQTTLKYTLPQKGTVEANLRLTSK